jgi:hypothetical protein
MTSSKYLPKGQVERILVPTDFSPGAKLALDMHWVRQQSEFCEKHWSR